jgi:surfactin synthase thioesterase subunit
MKKIKLFTLPFAGGAAAVYNPWRPLLDKDIELRSIELAGRGRRIYNPHYNSIEEAIDDVFNMIKDEITTTPYAIFGHSMGAIIAYELTYKIRKNNLPEPLHLFFSGRGAPDVPWDEGKKDFYDLPEDEFRESVIQLGGTPKEFFQHPELLEVLMPMLRSDFKIAETYFHDSEVIPFNHDISVYVGRAERLNEKQIQGWSRHTNQIASIHTFPGDHFFINGQTPKIVKLINYTLLEAFKAKN